MNRIELKKPAAIDEDFALWAEQQGALLRAGRFDSLDVPNLAEELESLGRADKYQILHRLEVLLAHLLKWEFQPEGRTNSWKATIVEQRARIRRLLEESPSLRRYPETVLANAYVIGLNTALTETGLPEAALPDRCPYSIEQVLDPGFYPGR